MDVRRKIIPLVMVVFCIIEMFFLWWSSKFNFHASWFLKATFYLQMLKIMLRFIWEYCATILFSFACNRLFGSISQRNKVFFGTQLLTIWSIDIPFPLCSCRLLFSIIKLMFLLFYLLYLINKLLFNAI